MHKYERGVEFDVYSKTQVELSSFEMKVQTKYTTWKMKKETLQQKLVNSEVTLKRIKKEVSLGEEKKDIKNYTRQVKMT